MSAEKFSVLYDSIRDKFPDSYLKRNSRSKLFHIIKLTSEMFRTAEVNIVTQSDALLKSYNVLVKQCEFNRSASEAPPKGCLVSLY